MDEFEQRCVAIVVAPKGQPIYSDRAFRIEIDDETAGEFVLIRPNADSGRGVAIDPGEWPALRDAIDLMTGECRA